MPSTTEAIISDVPMAHAIIIVGDCGSTSHPISNWEAPKMVHAINRLNIAERHALFDVGLLITDIVLISPSKHATKAIALPILWPICSGDELPAASAK